MREIERNCKNESLLHGTYKKDTGFDKSEKNTENRRDRLREEERD